MCCHNYGGPCTVPQLISDHPFFSNFILRLYLFHVWRKIVASIRAKIYDWAKKKEKKLLWFQWLKPHTIWVICLGLSTSIVLLFWKRLIHLLGYKKYKEFFSLYISVIARLLSYCLCIIKTHSMLLNKIRPQLRVCQKVYNTLALNWPG